MSDRDSGSGFVAGFFVGVIIGGVVGILFAPQPGEKTREQVKSKTAELTARAKETWEGAVKGGKETASRVGAELRQKLEEAKGTKTD